MNGDLLAYSETVGTRRTKFHPTTLSSAGKFSESLKIMAWQ